MSALSVPHQRSSLLRVTLLVLVAAVTLAGVALVGARPADGQAAPSFPCDGGLYVVTGSPTSMALNRVDQNSGSLTAIGGGGLTANALAGDREVCLEAGMDDFLAKPIRVADLKSMLDRYLVSDEG